MTVSEPALTSEVTVPSGVQVHPLVSHQDHRGALIELFRSSWHSALKPVQWNFTASNEGVLRGVHVHVRHYDYLVVLTGRASIGLRDLRRGSPTEGLSTLVPMGGDRLGALVIPPGVAHGFYFHEPSMHIYGVDDYWDPADELGCHWADEALQIPWPAAPTILSERDARLPLLSAILDLIPPFEHAG